jgi:hypothetical protein
MTDAIIELTIFTKGAGLGVLTKRIKLGADGKPESDGSECKMASGKARRARIADLDELATVIESLKKIEAIAIGRMRPKLGDKVIGDDVGIVVKNSEATANRDAVDHAIAIARTATNFTFEPGQLAPCLLDHDGKTMPPAVAEVVAAAGGFWPALVGVCPGFANAGRLVRNSTSAGLSRSDTGERFPSSGGLHTYVLVRDGSDIERFLADLEGRCWLAGLGWMALSAAGSYLVRSIIDVTVGAPERLVFEAPPVIEAPLVQDPVARRPVVHPGDAIDSYAVCPPLTSFERAEVRRLQDNGKRALVDERNRILVERTGKLAAQRGITVDAARRIVDDQCRGILSSELVLEFDDPEIARTTTVADLLDDPAKYEGQSLADPNEGISYGPGKGKVMINGRGRPWIHSFAHGRTIYQLRYSAAAVEERINRTSGDVLGCFISLVLRAELRRLELDDLIENVARRTNRKSSQIKAAVKEAQREEIERDRAETRERIRAERNDRRPILARPAPDAPLTEEMAKINDAITGAPIEGQLRRNLYGDAAKLRSQPVPNTYAFSSDKEESPDQWTIATLREFGLTEEIERFINYVDGEGESVRPPMAIVKAYTNRDDQALYTLAAIATQPIVLADGEILGRETGFDPTRGIQFIVPEAIAALVPRREDCAPDAVKKAMTFLTDEWLVDVEADYAVKCVIIAAALTVIERSLLPDRPAFFVTAGRRGSGKTTTIIMLIKALTGASPAASAWSPSEDERRKAILSQFMLGVPYILWDNIPRGFQVSCPHIERSCTSAYYADRKLGVSEIVATAATTIHFFTGNNIGPLGDLSSRSLMIRLKTNRPDPENREFKHPHPIAWTDAKRGEIFGALYTILLGNPALKLAREAAMKTRFKTWYRLIGSAVEHAAVQTGNVIDFEKQFAEQDEDDEDDAGLVDVLVAIDDWAKRLANNIGANNGKAPFKANELCVELNADDWGYSLRDAARTFFYPDLKAEERVGAVSLGRGLKRHVDEPVRRGEGTLTLRRERSDDSANATLEYWVETAGPASNGNGESSGVGGGGGGGGGGGTGAEGKPLFFLL